MSEQTLVFSIIIEKPVAGTFYGIQKGTGNRYETLQKQLADSDDLLFAVSLPVKRDKEGRPALYGPIIQGPLTGRFLYLDMGRYAGQENAPVSGRMKVPLPGITEDIVREATNGSVLLTRILGTKNGRPTTGLIKPFDGWKVVKP